MSKKRMQTRGKMKKIQINYLKLENFKGIKDLEVAFAPDLTVISGQNATGKTTIADAFSWVLFNSDTANRSDFKVQTHIDGKNWSPKLKRRWN